MRRCPHCQAPNPEQAAVCGACAQPLPPPVRESWLRLDDLWRPQALPRLGILLLLLLAFRIQAGPLLTAGAERMEARFLAFHLMQGLLLGLGAAWMRSSRSPLDWGLWVAAGLAGGLLAESLEVWYTYRQLMGMLTLLAWDWFGWQATPPLIYRILQGLRAAGLALPLLALALAQEKRFSRMLFAFALALAAVALRVPLRGAFLTWGGLAHAQGLAQAAWYLGSMAALLYALAPRPLTPGPQNR